jgi:hypothetical protein
LNSGKESFPLFRGIVQNGWLGITYVALDKMERFGVSYARLEITKKELCSKNGKV